MLISILAEAAASLSDIPDGSIPAATGGGGLLAAWLMYKKIEALRIEVTAKLELFGDKLQGFALAVQSMTTGQADLARRVDETSRVASEASKLEGRLASLELRAGKAEPIISQLDQTVHSVEVRLGVMTSQLEQAVKSHDEAHARIRRDVERTKEILSRLRHDAANRRAAASLETERITGEYPTDDP